MKKLAVAGRKYTKADGSEGTEWTNLGILNVNQNGKEYILLDPKINLAALPVGENGMVMVGVFEEQQPNSQPQQNGQQSYAQPQQNANSYQTPRGQYGNPNQQQQPQQPQQPQQHMSY